MPVTEDRICIQLAFWASCGCGARQPLPPIRIISLAPQQFTKLGFALTQSCTAPCTRGHFCALRWLWRTSSDHPAKPRIHAVSHKAAELANSLARPLPLGPRIPPGSGRGRPRLGLAARGWRRRRTRSSAGRIASAFRRTSAASGAMREAAFPR